MKILQNSMLALLFVSTVGTPATAQLPQASASSLGMGFNTTASARGFNAVANNPAGLGHPSSPGFSMVLPSVSGEASGGPISYTDIYDYQGEIVPPPIKAAWLDRIIDAGGERGAAGAGVTALAVSAGSIGLQVSTRAAATTSLAPDAAELLLYGNAGRTGAPRDFDLDDSYIQGFALTTAALSFGFQATNSLYVGATGKYVIGNGLVAGRNQGSALTGDPIAVEVEFPVMSPVGEDGEYDFFDNGTGLGLDVGVLWEGSGPAGMIVGATLQNVVNTFEWDLTGYVYTPGEAIFNQDSTSSNFDEADLDSAPAATQELFQSIADELTLPMIGSVGVQLEPTPYLRLQGDIRKTLTDGMEFDPDFHAGVGVELGILPFLPLRAHGAVITDGMQYGGGTSLVLGPVNLSAAVALRDLSYGDSVLASVTLSFGGN